MRDLPAGLAMVGGVLMAAGSVVDWSGVAYSSRVDRGIAFGAGAAAIAVAVVILRRGLRYALLALIPAAVGLNMAIVNYRDIDGHLHEYARYPDAAVGLGIYLLLAGGVATAGAAVAALLAYRAPG